MNEMNLVAGKYCLEKQIGTGAHGEVYQAVQLKDKNRVAVKIFYRHLHQDILQYILKELKVISSLSHPHILKVQAFGRGRFRDEMVHYLVTPLMENSNVSELLKKGKLEMPQAIKIATQIAQALDYMHENKFIHRDVKPSNILLDREKDAVLADFGIACDVDRTQTMAAGTIEYCAPEQMENSPGKKPNPQWDIYGLGITLYEMLTAINPYRIVANQQGQAAAIQKKYEGRYPSVTEYDGLIPYSLSLVIQKMISPQARYASMKEVLSELRLYDIGNEPSSVNFTKTEEIKLPENVNLLFQKAAFFSKQKLWKKALLKYNEILAKEPACYQAYSNKGDIYLQKKMYQDALANFNLALQYRPESYNALCQRGYTYLSMEDFVPALKDMEKAISLHPQRPQALFYRALLHKKLCEIYLKQNHKDLYCQENEQMKKYLDLYQKVKLSNRREDNV
ncbi:MAG: tetratricopeptide repeat protein [Candidatus Brocadiae bacterium]|nr:tetratricopeptide repeat protein [Candidatus Brocadiia bacterium]